jgi:hypothetical protein
MTAAAVTVAVVPTTARRDAVAVIVAMMMPMATVSSLCLVLLGVGGELDVAETVGEGGVVGLLQRGVVAPGARSTGWHLRPSKQNTNVKHQKTGRNVKIQKFKKIKTEP